MLLLPVLLLGASAATAPWLTSGALFGAGSPASVGNPVNVTVNGGVPGPGPLFWSISLDGGNSNPDTSSVRGFLNATPFTALRYGAAWVDDENWSNGCFYNGNSTCSPLSNNVSDYAKLCLSSPQYFCVLGVPAEINSVATLSYEVNWLQNTTGWEPNCWAIGNEPEVWTHFGIPWTSWSSTDKRTPTAGQYALVVANYTDTLRSIEGPNACIIGLEANPPLTNTETWTNTVTAAVPNDTAEAIHQYPDAKCVKAGVGQILSPANLTLTQVAYRDAAANAHGLPVYIQEFNLGIANPPTSCGPWVTGYTDSVFTSAVVAQALAGGDPQLTFFHFDCFTADCLVNANTSVPTPTYRLFADLLSQMDLNEMWNVTLTGGNAGAFAVLGGSGSNDRTLLLSNAQPHTWLNLSESSFVPAHWDIQTISQNWATGVTTSAVSTAPAVLPVRNQTTVLVHIWNATPPTGLANFTETGLPIGTTWTVQVSGQSPLAATVSGSGGTNQSLVLKDGTYSFSVTSSNSSWAPPFSPTFTIQGAPLNLSIPFSLVTYPVQFFETGLPGGTNWSVTVNGLTLNDPTVGGNDPLRFPAESNGTYAYSVPGIPGYHQDTIPYNGTLTVDGAADLTTLEYLPVDYDVTFSESGLPPGLNWNVTVNGATLGLVTDGGPDCLTWTGVPNGTYAYSVANLSGWHQSTLPYSGSVTVNGAPVTASSLEYNPVTYSIEFSESGLPSGVTFQVTTAGLTYALTTDGNTDGLSFAGLANGTYSYTITDVAGWHQGTLPYIGIVAVCGGSISEALTFVPVTFGVSFSETGLPSDTAWSVTFDGVTLSLTTDENFASLDFASEPNGTYTYSIAGNPGSVQTTIAYSGTETIDGAPLALSLAYTQLAYAVAFSETGLPSGLAWSVTLWGTSESLTTSGGTGSLSFAEPNGTFSYSITGNSGWHQKTLAYRGNLTIAGNSVSMATLVYSEVTYAVTFPESGLPSGTSWSVTLGSNTLSASGSTIGFTQPNGTYRFAVAIVPGFHSDHPSGSITVSGVGVKVTLAFSPTTYTVKFAETGLASGTVWSVTLDGVTQSGAPASISFAKIENGTYSYSLAPLAGYHTASYASSVTVAGGGPGTTASTLKIAWTEVKYAVKFSRAGLSAGTSWSVTIDSQTKSAEGSSMSFSLPNGTYPFSIAASGHAESSRPASPLVVSGKNATVSVTFVASSETSVQTAGSSPLIAASRFGT